MCSKSRATLMSSAKIRCPMILRGYETTRWHPDKQVRSRPGLKARWPESYFLEKWPEMLEFLDESSMCRYSVSTPSGPNLLVKTLNFRWPEILNISSYVVIPGPINQPESISPILTFAGGKASRRSTLRRWSQQSAVGSSTNYLNLSTNDEQTKWIKTDNGGRNRKGPGFRGKE